MSSETSKLLLIAAENSHSENLPTLWSVKQEISTVSDAARVAKLRVDVQHCASESATASQVAAALESANLVHIACHGMQSTTAPLESGFCLEDGRLTVQRLMDLDLKYAFFGFLSACETAAGDKEQPDQTIHLAAAMLFAGFKSVVATMW
jgi:CHAT domain-containing protein